MIIKRVEPVSFAKVMGTLYALLGLVLGVIFYLIGSAIGGLAGGVMPFGGVGLAAIIIAPIVYGCIGFVASLIGAALYNLVAGWVGGVVIQTE